MEQLKGLEPSAFSLATRRSTNWTITTWWRADLLYCAASRYHSFWSWRQDLNLQPDDYKAPALPIAPRQQMGGAFNPYLHRDRF